MRLPKLPPDAKCVHCGAPATEQWFPDPCALPKSKKKWLPVCTNCDIEINELVIRFFYGDKMERYLTAYREKKLEE